MGESEGGKEEGEESLGVHGRGGKECVYRKGVWV